MGDGQLSILKEACMSSPVGWGRIFSEWGSEVLSYRRRYATLSVEVGSKIVVYAVAAAEAEATRLGGRRWVGP